ncbi:MAG: hypothetical protein KJ968_04405 [Nanoarchaeota archaeon]|nr:hypothetical protein [Nanoarchaeota archaeon]
MELKRTMGILFLTGAIAATSYLGAGCAKTEKTKPIVQKKVIVVTEKQEQPMYGIAGKNIDEFLDYTEQIIKENHEEFKNYILNISKIGIENNYEKEIADMFSDELLEKRISEMPNERKLRIIRPLITEKIDNTYNKIIDFAEEQKPKVKEFYKNLEKKVNDYLNEGER